MRRIFKKNTIANILISTAITVASCVPVVGNAEQYCKVDGNNGNIEIYSLDETTEPFIIWWTNGAYAIAPTIDTTYAESFEVNTETDRYTCIRVTPRVNEDSTGTQVSKLNVFLYKSSNNSDIEFGILNGRYEVSKLINPSGAVVKGDLNYDDKVTISDCVKFKRLMLGMDNMYPWFKYRCDLDGDNDVTFNDSILFRKLFLKNSQKLFSMVQMLDNEPATSDDISDEVLNIVDIVNTFDAE